MQSGIMFSPWNPCIVLTLIAGTFLHYLNIPEESATGISIGALGSIGTFWDGS